MAKRGRAPNERLLAEELSNRRSSSRHQNRADDALRRKLRKKYLKLAKNHPAEFAKAAKQILGEDR